MLMLIAGAAEAQAIGYAVAGPAGTSGFVNTNTAIHAAGGVEVFAAERFGAGGEVGFFNRLVTGSANATWHFAVASHGFADAFVTGGYSRFGIFDGEGGFHAWNVGIGAHLWLGDRAGLRLEFRDHIRPDSRGTTQYWSLRAGVAFR
jgi:hypothetical protein